MSAPIMSRASELFPAVRTTPLPGGYMGKILRVNLSTGECRDENLPEEPILRQYIGGQALATYILMKEQDSEVQPYAPESKLVMMTGPLTGTGLTPGGTKVCAVFRSPLTGRTLGRGAASGFWAIALKGAGYDGLILEGAAAQPCFIYIRAGRVEIRDAQPIWGKGARESEDLLRAAVGVPDARVMTIGPAGEHLVPAAMILNDYNHSVSHSGGAIFGSKKLKGIVVHGGQKPRIHDKTALVAAGMRWRRTLNVRTPEEKHGFGFAEHLQALPNKNFMSTLISDQNIGFDQNKVRLRPCFACHTLCPWDVEIGEGPYRGFVARFNAGSEWEDTFWNLGIKGNAVLYLAERINDLGIECSHWAFGAAVAFEAFDKGLLTLADTDGMAFTWGNIEVADRLLDLCARREGKWGQLLAEGPFEVAQHIGGDAVKWVVHTKKGTPALHDWRPHFGMMIKELVASGGMKPQGTAQPMPPPDLRYREKWGPLSREQPEGWSWATILSEQTRQFCGLFGACWFAQTPIKPDGLNSIVDSFNATTGWQFTMDEALTAGHRSMILQSLFATQRGWVADMDWQDVGQRFLDPVPDGKFKGFTIAKWLPGLVYDYYRLSGRHEQTGRPLLATLRHLGMEEFREWAAPDAVSA